MFKTNEGSTDRWIRAIAGVVILGIAYYKLAGGMQIAGYIIGVVLVFTAITGFCGLYKLLGISTIEKKDEVPGKHYPLGIVIA